MASTGTTEASAIVAEIRAQMGRANIKVPTLARSIDRSYDWLYRRLNGARSPSLDDLELICSGLDIRLSDLTRAA